MQMMEGVKVVEAAQWIMAPSAGAVLADWGADVIRIEHPTTVDPLRSVLPTQGLDSTFDFYIENNNHSKRCIGLDLATTEGRGVFLRLIEDADVFITSFLEAAREKWRITYDDLRAVNPRLIYAALARAGGARTRGERSRVRRDLVLGPQRRGLHGDSRRNEARPCAGERLRRRAGWSGARRGHRRCLVPAHDDR